MLVEEQCRGSWQVRRAARRAISSAASATAAASRHGATGGGVDARRRRIGALSYDRGMFFRSPFRSALVALLATLAAVVSAVAANPALAASGWEPVGDMGAVHPRLGAALLRDGRVLVASGFSNGGDVPVAELDRPGDRRVDAGGACRSCRATTRR